MRGLRLGTAIAVVLGLLAVAVWAFSSDGDSGEAAAASTSTATPPTTSTSRPVTSSTSTTSTTVAETTSTTSVEQRVAEVEAILEELWFGWFDAIYRQDEDALWQVVATTTKHTEGVEAMEIAGFDRAPTPEDIDIEVIEILLDRPDCLVVYDEIVVSGFNDGVSAGVDVLWPDDRYGWRIATAWVNPNDLWQADCDDLEREPTP